MNPRMDRRALVAKLDAAQQKHPLLAVPVATLKKFDDDQASNLAAVIAFYAFFSVFPLLLVFVTILGYVLAGDKSALDSVQNSVLARFPVIGHQIADKRIKGSAVALVDRHLADALRRPRCDRCSEERLRPHLASSEARARRVDPHEAARRRAARDARHDVRGRVGRVGLVSSGLGGAAAGRVRDPVLDPAEHRPVPGLVQGSVFREAVLALTAAGHDRSPRCCGRPCS